MLDAGSGSNVKPGFVLEHFFEEAGVILPEFPFMVCRPETYKRDFDGKLKPLIS